MNSTQPDLLNPTITTTDLFYTDQSQDSVFQLLRLYDAEIWHWQSHHSTPGFNSLWSVHFSIPESSLEPLLSLLPPQNFHDFLTRLPPKLSKILKKQLNDQQNPDVLWGTLTAFNPEVGF